MPAASKAIKYTWIPKGAGKGGMFSNSTSHDSDTDTLVRVYDFLIDGGKWCPRPADTVFSNLLLGHAQAMFIYNFYNETSTVGTSKLLADLISDGSAQQNHAVGFHGALAGQNHDRTGLAGEVALVEEFGQGCAVAIALERVVRFESRNHESVGFDGFAGFFCEIELHGFSKKVRRGLIYQRAGESKWNTERGRCRTRCRVSLRSANHHVSFALWQAQA